MCGRVGRSNRDELFVYSQPFLEPAFGGEVPGLHAKDFRERRRGGENLPEELDLEVELAAVGEEADDRAGWELVVG